MTFLIIGLVFGGMLGYFVDGPVSSVSEGYQKGSVISRLYWVSVPYDIVLAVGLLWSRTGVANVLLALTAFLLSFTGALFGLIPLAVLTTRPSAKSREEIGQVFE